MLAGAAVLLVLALAAGGIATVQSDRAHTSAAAALAAEAAAQQAARSALARRAAARATVTDVIDESLLLGAAAVALEDLPETLSSLIDVLADRPSLIRSTPLAGTEAFALDLSSDGRRVATIERTHRVRLTDLASGVQIAERPVGTERFDFDERRPLTFSPDGTVLAVGLNPLTRSPVVLLDGHTLVRQPWQPSGVPRGEWQTIGLTFSGDGSTLAAVLNRLVVEDRSPEIAATVALVWSLGSRRDPVLVDLTNETHAADVALSHDGHVLYAVPGALSRDLRTGQERTLAPGDTGADVVDISPDSDRLLALTAAEDGLTTLFDLRTQRLGHRFRSDGGGVSNVRFSDDGRRLLAATGFVRLTTVWDVVSGAEVVRLDLGSGNDYAIDLDPRGDGPSSARALTTHYADGTWTGAGLTCVACRSTSPPPAS